MYKTSVVRNRHECDYTSMILSEKHRCALLHTRKCPWLSFVEKSHKWKLFQNNAFSTHTNIGSTLDYTAEHFFRHFNGTHVSKRDMSQIVTFDQRCSAFGPGRWTTERWILGAKIRRAKICSRSSRNWVLQSNPICDNFREPLNSFV